MSRRKTGRPRGRPRQDRAKRRARATTRLGRRLGMDPVDPGTPELRARRMFATGSEALSHEDPLAALYGHGWLTTAQYNAGRDIAEQIAIVSGSRSLTIWRRILEGPGGLAEVEMSAAGERAMRTLDRLRNVIGHGAEMIYRVCAGTWLPAIVLLIAGERLRLVDVAELKAIADGLERVAGFWAPAAVKN